MHFEIYMDKAKQWRWRLQATNGKIVADSGEGYVHEHHARDMVAKILKLDDDTLVLTNPLG